MMEQSDHSSPMPSSSSSTATTTSVNGGPSGSAPSSSSPSSSSSQVQVEVDVDEDNPQQHQEQEQNQTNISNGVHIQVSNAFSSDMRDDACSCFVVLITFWFFASMTLILGFYGPENLRLGPNCSRLLQANSFFISEIKVEELAGPDHGLMLYGFYSPPPLDIVTTWSENYNPSVPANTHEEWIYFLNEGSDINITYTVKSHNSSPIYLVIAEGKESLIEWTQSPSYPNLTLSWNFVYGSGMIQQNISQSSDYYIAVGNLNSQEVEVQLNIGIRAFLYNTTEAYYKCSLSSGSCSLNLLLMGAGAAVLTSSGLEQGSPSEDWYVKLSYGQRWVSYFVGSGTMTMLLVLIFKMCTKFQSTDRVGTGYQAGEVGSERAPLLVQKDDDLSSWGSSYDSVSHDEEDLEEALIASALEAKPLKDGENNNPRRLCVICFDAPRDCFFLPCGHCAACFTCGTRIAEEAGTCPICRRKMKKVRKIFAV